LLTAAGYVVGCLVIGRSVYGSERFLASPGQLAGAAAVGLVLVAVAFAFRPTRQPVTDCCVPRPLPLGLGVFVALSIYQIRTESWAGMVFGIAWVALLAVPLSWFARQRQWGPRHQLALVAAALGTYAWLGFVLTLLVEPGDPVRWAGNIAFATFALALVLTARSRTPAVTEEPSVGRHASAAKIRTSCRNSGPRGQAHDRAGSGSVGNSRIWRGPSPERSPARTCVSPAFAAAGNWLRTLPVGWFRWTCR
jgi:hypothetical protein